MDDEDDRSLHPTRNQGMIDPPMPNPAHNPQTPPRGKCPQCGRSVRLDEAGRLNPHGPDPSSDFLCGGSLEPTRGQDGDGPRSRSRTPSYDAAVKDPLIFGLLIAVALLSGMTVVAVVIAVFR
jgi:hypothetical protein